MMRLPILRDLSLASRTTLGVGGAASRLVEPLLVEELQLVLRAAANENAPLLILGGGSNMLVADAGFDGLVISPALYGLMLEPLADHRVRVVAGAGVLALS
jgi:UDP-N-acetylmuramate dehydrogenase